MTDEEATAYHEAGHAVMAALNGRPPKLVHIVCNGDIAGVNEFIDDMPPEFANHLSDSPEKRKYIEIRVLIALAGMIAHDLRFPARVRDAGDAHDEARARAIIEDYAGWADNCRESYFLQRQETARALLQANWLWVDAVAHALIEQRNLPGQKVIELRPCQREPGD
jgi:ATP-dependent Zn protease